MYPHGIRGSFDTIIGYDTPAEERGFVSVGHPVGTDEFVRTFCNNRAAADKIRQKLDCLRVLDGHPQVQLSLLRLCVVPTCVSVARAVHCEAYASSIGEVNTLLHDAVARLADIPSWDGHDASRARVAMPLKAGGLGVYVLANPDHAAVAAMSSAVASLHAFARDVGALGGWLGNDGYGWLVTAANTALDPDALEDPPPPSSAVTSAPACRCAVPGVFLELSACVFAPAVSRPCSLHIHYA